MSVKSVLVGLFGGLFLLGLWVGVFCGICIVNHFWWNFSWLLCLLVVLISGIGLYFSVNWYIVKEVRGRR